MTLHVYWFGFWLRLGMDGPGVRIDVGAPLLFSERYGFNRSIVRLGSIRFERLHGWSRSPPPQGGG